MQSIPTPEGVTLEVELAGLGSRTLAFLLDTTLALLVMLVLQIALQIILLLVGLDDLHEFFSGFAGAATVLVVGYYLILGAMAVLMDGTTPGKRAVGLRVIGADGTPVSAMQYMLRTLVLFVDMTPPFIGPLLLFFSPRPRRLGDWAAGTVVVRESDAESLLDPWLKQSWKARDSRVLELSPGVAARFDERDLALMRDIILRRDLEPHAARILHREAAQAFCARAGVESTTDPRRALKDLFLFLREARGD